MSSIQLQIPESVLEEARRQASKENIPLDYYVALVLTRHVATLQGVKYMEERAKHAPTREEVLKILDKFPDVPPMPGDELPE